MLRPRTFIESFVSSWGRSSSLGKSARSGAPRSGTLSGFGDGRIMTRLARDNPDSSLGSDAVLKRVAREPRYGVGIAAMVLASLSFAVMAASAKAARADLEGPVVVLARSVFLVAVLLVWMRSKSVPLRGRRPLLLHARGALGALGLNLYYYALGQAPLGEVVVLANTAPLYVPFLGILFLGERPRGALIALLVFGFAGVVAIALSGSTPGVAGETARWGLLAATGTGLSNAAALVCVKRLTADEHPLTIVFTFAVWSLVVTSPALALVDLDMVRAAAGALLLTGVGAIGGQIFITYALSCAPAGILMVFNYVGVVVAFLIGVALWGERPSTPTVVGALLIVAVCVVTTRYARVLIR